MGSDTPELLGSGVLRGMRAQHAEPVEYSLEVDARPIPLNQSLGYTLAIRFDGAISCSNCGGVTRKSYGDGYCYPCFKTLARCDLCVVSPARCHYALGTCREPEWGEAFCMQEHLVYLANSAGPKVGITRPGNVPGRWLDQGATQAMLLFRTATRHQAGCIEAALARYVSDRTDWRGLIERDAPDIDLEALAADVVRSAAAELDALRARFPNDLVRVAEGAPQRFRYPVQAYASPPRTLTLVAGATTGGVLLGIKGQYLLFDRGVFNVARHTSYHVEVARGPGRAVATRDQLELFG